MKPDAALASDRLRILLYAQHLSGVGHFVRMHELARALAGRHEVWLTDGGREVPRRTHGGVRLLALPRIARGASGIASIDAASPVAQAMHRRCEVLADAVTRLRPQVLVVEHFPFSKWELRAEIEGLIAAVRHADHGARVICSLRDIPGQTSHEDCAPMHWQQTVIRDLHRLFDGIMVHGEESWTPLIRYLPSAGDIRIPVNYTGLIGEEPGAVGRDASGPRGSHVLASVGGGSDEADLLATCIGAWKLLTARSVTGDRRLTLFTGLRGKAPGELLPDTTVLGFDSSFLATLAAAELSVSYAGYNTCANLLATGTRSILVPNPRMSDQALRAQVMRSVCSATVISAADLTPLVLADAMSRALRSPLPPATVSLDGAARAATFIGSLARHHH